MGEGVHIRRATAKDRSTVLAFHRALYAEHRDRLLAEEIAPLYAYKDLDAALRDDVDAILSSPTSVALLAERDGRAVGYVTGHVEVDTRRSHPHKGVIEDWLVVPEARGSGVGRALYETLVEIFREAGCELLESTTWASNADARAVHGHLGFHDIEIKMRRRL